MSKIISGNELRERLLSRLAAAETPAPDAWVQALSAQGNRELLGLIALRRPQSISELSEFASRAQPNVSRSLSALVRAGLIELTADGRTSIPTLTALGLEKAADIGLVVNQVVQAAQSAATLEPPFLSVALSDDHSDTDHIAGDLSLAVIQSGYEEPVIAKFRGDLNSTALAILDQWWRIFYRRDSPYKLGEFSFASGSSERTISLILRSTGNRVERIVRSKDETPFFITSTKRYEVLEGSETNLLEDVIRPIAAEMRARRRYDRPVQSKLARLEETLSNSREARFARTAGSLGISLYHLTSDGAQRVRHLIETIPDEEPRLDFASAVLTDEVDAAAEWISLQFEKHGDLNSMPGLKEISESIIRPARKAAARPWKQGIAMAKLVREQLHINPTRRISSVKELADMFGASGFEASPRAPGSLRAFQSNARSVPTVVVEDENPASTKFLLARAIGDFVVFRSSASCVANLYTDRQAVGRAFAAEFVAPAEGVVHMIEDDGWSVTRVAAHYGATEDVIKHQYDNNIRSFVDA